MAELSGFPETLGNAPGPEALLSCPQLPYHSLPNEQSIKLRPGQHDYKFGKKKIRGKGAAHVIREECERLFCETMRVVFLGEEGRYTDNGSYDMIASKPVSGKNTLYTHEKRQCTKVGAYFEMWDYVGGSSFRGFVGGHGNKQGLFIFFEKSIIHKDLKRGLMALIDFAEVVFDVAQITMCLDRSIPENETKFLLKSLSWVGFKPVTLESRINEIQTSDISSKWFFLGMEM